MKLRNFILAIIITFATAGSITAAVWAIDAKQPEPRTVQPAADAEMQSDINAGKQSDTDTNTEKPTQLPSPTFSAEETNDSAGILWFGKNLLYAGNNVTANNISRGLLFAAGNNLQLGTQSEYAFVAGNTIIFNATTEKDLFLAGNNIAVTKNAEVGRDIFATGNTFLLEANIPSDVSVAVARASFKDTVIQGNLNISAGYIDFSGQVEVNGALTYNEDAVVSGLSNVKSAKTETYTPVRHETTASEIWLTKMMKVAGLFFTITIILLVFPGAKQGIARETTVQRFGASLLLGLGFAIIVPLLALAFLLSFLAVSTAIFLIVVYCLIFYLASAFSGAWLGHVIVEKLCHCTLPMIVEALIGILVITCAGMIPGLGFLVSTFSFVLGAGLIMACLRSGSSKKQISDDNHVYYTAAAETSTKPGKSSRSTQKNSITKPVSAKVLTKATSAKSSTKTPSAKSSSKTATKTSPSKTAKTPKPKK